MKKRLTTIATLVAVLSALAIGPANAITVQFCEDGGGVAMGMQDGTWWCVGGIGNDLQILFP